METKSPDHLKADIPHPSPSFEEIAAQQGVEPVRDVTELLGTPDPGDESVEEFSKILRNWHSRKGKLRALSDERGNR